MADVLKLVDGNFTPDECEEILLSLINDKISFHQRHIFSCEERNVTDRLNSKNRINELEELMTSVMSVTQKAREENLNITIEGDIKLTLKNKINK